MVYCYLSSACNRFPLYSIFTISLLLAISLFTVPDSAHATQMHSSSEGVIVHQIGHLFFLISMVVLYFTIKEKSLHSEKGWRLIQLSALLFVMWNLDALLVHFLDNQVQIILPEVLSVWEIKVEAADRSSGLVWFYYLLRLDHLLCLPAMILFWRGLLLIFRSDSCEKVDNDLSSHKEVV